MSEVIPDSMLTSPSPPQRWRSPCSHAERRKSPHVIHLELTDTNREPQEAQLKLLEPLRELFKDEVRAFGRQLKIHEELIGRHPFPGPGLGIRILGEVTRERVAIVRQADHIFISMIREAGIYDEVTQAYAALDTNRGKSISGFL